MCSSIIKKAFYNPYVRNQSFPFNYEEIIVQTSPLRKVCSGSILETEIAEYYTSYIWEIIICEKFEAGWKTTVRKLLDSISNTFDARF